MKLTFNLLTVLIAAGNISYAQNTGGNNSPAKAQTATASSIASVTQGMKKYEGFFNFYYEEKNGKVFLEVDKLDQEFLYFPSLSDGVGNGGPERGQASSAIAKFVKVGPKILLVEPSNSYAWL